MIKEARGRNDLTGGGRRKLRAASEHMRTLLIMNHIARDKHEILASLSLLLFQFLVITRMNKQGIHVSLAECRAKVEK